MRPPGRLGGDLDTGGESAACQVTIEKSTGLMSECIFKGANYESTWRREKLVVNPTPPIAGSYFEFKPKPGVEVKDITDDMIRQASR